MSIESNVSDILVNKRSRLIHTISPKASVLSALQIMAKYDVACLLVLENHELLGIITERDYSRKVALKNKSSQATSVQEIMQPAVFRVTPVDSTKKCLRIMSEYRIRHLPVYDSHSIIGVVSMGDIMYATIQDKEFMIDQLENYVGWGKVPTIT